MVSTTTCLTLTVSQLTNAIKHCLESTFPLFTVQGEISNSKLHTSGHFYFSLKDQQAQIAAIMYRKEVSNLRNLPKEGEQVVIRGAINLYPLGGKYQIIVKELKPIGLGALLLKLEELKVQLLQKGYFKKEYKKSLPKLPLKIGVVTSPTGAVIQDIIQVLTRRFPGFHLILNPVKVQGEGAAEEIVQAIQQFNQYSLVDVLIVGRGGGSIEDLWAFNEESVAEAIFNSAIPIISAVGHETDHCIADYVADVRAPTPSAAAEMVILEKAEQLEKLKRLQQRLKQTLQHVIRYQKEQLKGICRSSIFQTPYGLLGLWMQKLDDYRQNLDDGLDYRIQQKRISLESAALLTYSLKPTVQILFFQQKLMNYIKTLHYYLNDRLANLKLQLKQIRDSLEQIWQLQQQNRYALVPIDHKRKGLDQAVHRLLMLKKERLQQLMNALHSINPKNLLTKGYAIVFAEKNRTVITSISNVEKRQEIRLLLTDGEILSTIKEVFSV